MSFLGLFGAAAKQEVLLSPHQMGLQRRPDLIRVTPETVTEKFFERMMEYNKIAPYKDMDDLLARIGVHDPNRMVLALIDPNDRDAQDRANTPITFIEGIVLPQLADNLQGILDRRTNVLTPGNTLVCYAWVSAPGVKGVGSDFIKADREWVFEKMPGIEDFGTLSPMEGFCAWLKNMSPDQVQDARQRLQDLPTGFDELKAKVLHSAEHDEHVEYDAQQSLGLQRLGAMFIMSANPEVMAQGGRFKAMNTAAAIHFGCGAALWGFCVGADQSSLGRRRSGELMAVFRYPRDDDTLHKNVNWYRQGQPAHANRVASLLNSEPLDCVLAHDVERRPAPRQMRRLWWRGPDVSVVRRHAIGGRIATATL